MISLMCQCSTQKSYRWNTNKEHGAAGLKNTLQSLGGFLNVLKFHTPIQGSRERVCNIVYRIIEYYYYICNITIVNLFKFKNKAKLCFVNIPKRWNLNGTLANKQIVENSHEGVPV